MFIHIVTFRWKDDVSPAHVALIKEALSELPTKISVIRQYRFGSDAGVSAGGNFDFAVVAEFDSKDDWHVYDTHPEHTRVRTEVLLPAIRERAAVQFQA